MDDSEFQRMPNPFSPFAQEPTHRRRNLLASVKLLLAAFTLFAVATASQAYLHRARLAALIGDISSGSRSEKLARLEQLSASGPDGISGLVAAVGDEDSKVSNQAFDLLMETGARLGTLPTDQRRERQAAFATALLRLVETIEEVGDPRFQRAQTLARQAITQWSPTESASPMDEHHRVIGQTLAEVLRHGEADVRLPSDTPPQLADSPLPVELAGPRSASWTDWPPAPLAPQLYRRPVATLNVEDQPTVVLSQFDEPESETAELKTRAGGSGDASKARIVKPSYRPAGSLREQPMRVPGGTTETADYWVAQLGNPSRHVRLRAVTELARRGDEACRRALREHLADETDHGVAFRIRKVLDKPAASP